MRIYIAGRISQRDELHDVRRAIWELGHEVLATWIDETPNWNESLVHGGNVYGRSIAMRDLTQISMADVFILDTTSPLAADGGGGREFEAGFAFGQFQHKQRWRVGPPKNAFHHLVDQSFENWDQCLKFLEGLNGSRHHRTDGKAD